LKMIKRMLMMTLILAMLSSVCYGAVPEDTVQPFNLTVMRFTPSFTIDSDGSATGTLKVKPNGEGVLDEVVALFDVEYVDSGERVFRQSKGLTYSSAKGEFSGSVTFDVEDRGAYCMEITFYCYSEDRLIETIRPDEMVRMY